MTNTTPLTKKRKSSIVAVDIIFDHARVDPTHCLANGLFRPIKRGKRAEAPLDITHPYKKEHTFRWQHETEQLCIQEQSVFLAVLYLASVPGRAIMVDTNHLDAKMQEARNTLGLMLGAADSACLMITTTARELANTLDLAISGPALTRIKDSLNRLAGVSFSITPNGVDNPIWKSMLLSVVHIDGKNLLIGISPTLCKALGDEKAAITYIDMKQQRDLTSDAAKRLHVWLSAWLRPTEGKTIGLDLLVKHVWGDTGTGDTLYSRRNTIKTSLPELKEHTGWICEHKLGSDKAFIKRTKLGQQAP